MQFNAMLITDRLGRRSGVAAINRYFLYLMTPFRLFGQRLRQQLSVIAIVAGRLHTGYQLHRIVRVASLTDVADIAPIPFAILLPIGRFRVMRRLQTVRRHFRRWSQLDGRVVFYIHTAPATPGLPTGTLRCWPRPAPIPSAG